MNREEEILDGMADFENRISLLEALHKSSNAHMALKDEDLLYSIDQRIRENETIDAISYQWLQEKLEELDEHLQGITKYYTTLKENVNQLQSRISKQYSKSNYD